MHAFGIISPCQDDFGPSRVAALLQKLAEFMTLCEPNACGGFLRECFACRKQILSV